MDKIKDNYSGVKLGLAPGNWIAGANSPIGSSLLLPTGDWKPYTSAHEVQVFNAGYTNAYDTSLCTAYAGTDAIEHIINRMIFTGEIPVQTLDWLNENDYLVNGKLELSERFTGANSEMTLQGTYTYKTAESMRMLGVVPQSVLELADNFDDNIDPDLIDDDVYELGRQFKERININWQWENNTDALVNSPLTSTVKFATANGDDILAPEGTHNHAILTVNKESNYTEIDDSYWQQYKRYNNDYVDWFMSFNITFNITNMNVNEFIEDNDTNIIRNINTGGYGVIYAGNFLKITDERAGIFSVDRMARNIKDNKMVSVNNEEWLQLDYKDLYF